MKIKNKKDFILGVVCLILSVWIIVMTLGLPNAQYEGDPGPKMFPMIGGVIIAVCGILLIVKQGEPGKEFMTKAQWIDTCKFFSVYLLALALMYVFGWTIATPILLFILTFMLSKISLPDASVKKRVVTSLIWAVLCGIGIYLVYKVGLKAKLPRPMFYKSLPLSIRKWF